MKKFSIVLLTVALALVFAVPAMAIHIGDIRDADEGALGINGKYTLDGEKTDYDGAENAWYDNDVDVNFTWNLGDVTVRWRAELNDDGANGVLPAKNNNIVDDLDHVNRAGTSIHLTSEQKGDTSFVHGSLGDILLGKVNLPAPDGRKVIFSPFGMGVLDLAVANLVQKSLARDGDGSFVKSFLPGA